MPFPPLPARSDASTGIHTPPAWRAAGTKITDPGSTTFPVHIELDKPQHGIVLARGSDEPDHLLGLKLTAGCGLVDSWLRGDDVTAVYQSADGHSLRSTAMWRVHHAVAVARAWELVASAQTALLATIPDVSVVSTVDGDELRWAVGDADGIAWVPSRPASGACVLLRRRNHGRSQPTSLLVMAHPAETRGLTVTSRGPRLAIECGLFPDALEKGVLVRSRLLAAIGPTAGAETWAERLVSAFSNAPPILTT